MKPSLHMMNHSWGPDIIKVPCEVLRWCRWNMKLTPPCRDISWQEVSNKVMQPFIYPSLPMHFSPLFISSLVTLSQIHSASTAVWKQNFFWFTSFFCRLPWKSLDKTAVSQYYLFVKSDIKKTISGTVTHSKQVCLMVTEKNGKLSRVDGWAGNHCLYTTTFSNSFCKI